MMQDFEEYTQRGVDYDYSFLVKFFSNLFMGEQNELRNRYFHLDYKTADDVQSATAKGLDEVPKGQNDTLNCTLEEQAILNVIIDNAHATQKEMATIIRKSERTVKRITTALTERGIIERKNGKRNGYWAIIVNENE